MKQLAVLFLLAACAAPAPPLRPAPPVQAPDTCGASGFAGLVGGDATALERVLLMGQVRVIRPGDMVTRDFRPTRINFHIGENGLIQRIDCG